MPKGNLRILSVLLGSVVNLSAQAGDGQEEKSQPVKSLDEVVVTAPRSEEPLTVITNPKAPRQPIPAHDGAEYLKNIPGFSIIRKGGTDGDPVLRGMAGSRLNILLDGQQIFGGCGGRMDPPTAYVFPGAYDRITVHKGPQSVLNGPGSSAGSVSFERDIQRFGTPGLKANGSLTLGSFERNDEMGDLRLGGPQGYVQVGGTRTDANDYEDGSSRKVHSAYTRWSSNAAVGWTPSDDALLELSAIRSDGEAAYADRSMDGTQFARDNVALKLIKKNLSPLLRQVDAQVYYNYVDHVMDNYSLRTPTLSSGMGGSYTYMVNNPDRETSGGKLTATLAVTERTDLTLGLDVKRDLHTLRSASTTRGADAANSAYLAAARVEDMEFQQFGLFGELTQYLAQDHKLVAGLRLDEHRAEDSRPCVSGSLCPGNPNNTRGADDHESLPSGFVRYEGQLDQWGVWYAGVGHVQRTPDYWERRNFAPGSTSTANGKSAFLVTDPEKTTQLDVGLHWRHGPWSGALAAFYGLVEDYILIRWSPTPTLTRNVDATVYGGEAEVGYKATEAITLNASLATVWGENRTDHKPLAQQPPAELKLGAEYDDQTYSFGLLWRLVAEQERVDLGSGNIVANGMDIGQTAGFDVLSLHAGWRTTKETKLTAGIDNLFDRTYAEHLSRGGASVPGYLVPVNTHINEPGRLFWVKFSVEF